MKHLEQQFEAHLVMPNVVNKTKQTKQNYNKTPKQHPKVKHFVLI